MELSAGGIEHSKRNFVDRVVSPAGPATTPPCMLSISSGYLNSLSQKTSQQSLLANSAALHEADVFSRQQ